MKEYTGYFRFSSPVREHLEARGEAIADRHAFDRDEAGWEAQVARLAAYAALIAALNAGS